MSRMEVAKRTKSEKPTAHISAEKNEAVAKVSSGISMLALRRSYFRLG